MSKIYIVVTEPGEAVALMSFLHLQADDAVTMVVGPRELAEEASAATTAVKWINTGNIPTENYARAAADALAAAMPTAVIGVASPGTRAVIGRLAVKMGASLVSNMNSVTIDEGKILAECSVLGDKMIEKLEMPLHSCLLVNPFSLPPKEADAIMIPERIEEIVEGSDNAVSYLSVEPSVASRLQTADRIVGVGLGAASEGLFEQTKQLAGILGAEMGCSMPIYNELQLMPHETYIGVTGIKVAPKLYLALGISGTSQHCAGVRNAKVVVCVNKDPKALFFDNADYGIIGDLNEVLPKLISILK